MPRGCSLQLFVDVVDVLYAFSFQPFAERSCALLGVDRNAVLPGSSSAEHAIELYARFSGEFEGLAEFCIADSSGEINKRLGGNARSFVEEIDSFFLRISLHASKRFRSLDILHVHRHFD